MTSPGDDTQRETDLPGHAVKGRPPAALRRAWRFLRSYVGEVTADRLLGLAAEIAFFAVLGLVPGLLIAVGLLGSLDVVIGGDVAAGVERQVLAALGGALTDRAAPLLDAVQALFGQAHDRLLTIAGLGALVTVSGAFAVVIEALNLVYDVEETRSWIRRRLLGLVFGLATLVVGVLAPAAIVVGPLLGRRP